MLDAFAIGRLCSGEIRTWDDDYLVSLNPWLVGVGTVPIVLQAEPSTSDTMAALRDKLQALRQRAELLAGILSHHRRDMLQAL